MPTVMSRAFFCIGFGARAQAKDDKSRDCNEDDDPKGYKWMSDESTHGDACRLRVRRLPDEPTEEQRHIFDHRCFMGQVHG